MQIFIIKKYFFTIDKSNKMIYTIKADKKLHTSGCSADGSALALGARCRRFDSCHSDHSGKGALKGTFFVVH